MEPLDLNTIRILEDYKNGRIDAGEAAQRLAAIGRREVSPPAESLTDSAILDPGRESRAGFPEAIFGAAKTPGQICENFMRLYDETGKALATRCSSEALQMLARKCPSANINHSCGLAWAVSDIVLHPWGKSAVLAAGTSDLPVAEEASLTLEFMGFSVERMFDVGVAGLHRLLNRVDKLKAVDVAIVVAGMEGALPSVVGGLVPCPIIAVPTSVGYGASFNGLAALLGMLNSCSAGVTVVNIDNGFGAAAAAVRILKGKVK